MKFKYTQITEFEGCMGCPFYTFVDDDDSPTHVECGKTKTWIYEWRNKSEKDYRATDGVLEDCPFLKTNEIVEVEKNKF